MDVSVIKLIVVLGLWLAVVWGFSQTFKDHRPKRKKRDGDTNG